MSAVETTPEIETVQAFLTALEYLDIDRAVGMLAPDVVYQNVSLPAAHSAETVRKQLGLLAQCCTGFEARIHRIAANGTTVLTERTDVMARGRFSAEFWVCGVFEVVDGKITLWRDYFDWANVLAGFAKGAGRWGWGLLGRGCPAGHRKTYQPRSQRL